MGDMNSQSPAQCSSHLHIPPMTSLLRTSTLPQSLSITTQVTFSHSQRNRLASCYFFLFLVNLTVWDRCLPLLKFINCFTIQKKYFQWRKEGRKRSQVNFITQAICHLNCPLLPNNSGHKKISAISFSIFCKITKYFFFKLIDTSKVHLYLLWAVKDINLFFAKGREICAEWTVVTLQLHCYRGLYYFTD